MTKSTWVFQNQIKQSPRQEQVVKEKEDMMIELGGTKGITTGVPVRETEKINRMITTKDQNAT